MRTKGQYRAVKQIFLALLSCSPVLFICYNKIFKAIQQSKLILDSNVAGELEELFKIGKLVKSTTPKAACDSNDLFQ